MISQELSGFQKWWENRFKLCKQWSRRCWI